jgi:hypothetical protein
VTCSRATRASTYGQNPCQGYDTDPAARPFDYSGRLDPRLPPVERVESITIAADTIVIPFETLKRQPVTTATVGGRLPWCCSTRTFSHHSMS